MSNINGHIRVEFWTHINHTLNTKYLHQSKEGDWQVELNKV